MRFPTILASVAFLAGCAEIPPPEAMVRTEEAAIDIGLQACKPDRLKDESDTHFRARLTEYGDRQRDRWEAIYADGVWEVGGGHRYSLAREKKCHDLQVQVDAKTGKPGECQECVIVG